MNNRQRRARLVEAGFVHVRNGSKHEIWKKGDQVISLSYGSGISPHTHRSFKSVMRRELAVEKAIAAADAVIQSLHELPKASAHYPENDMIPNKNSLAVVPQRMVGKHPVYSPEDRKSVRDAIIRLRDQGYSVKDSAAELCAMGIKTPAGGAPDKMFVANQWVHIRAEAKRGKVGIKPKKTALPQVRVTKAATIGSELQLSILTDPALSDKKKLELLAVLLS